MPLVSLESVELCEPKVFEHARPSTVIVTMPNAQYNVVWESLPAGKFRHSDHRFEWTRSEFEAWSAKLCKSSDDITGEIQSQLKRAFISIRLNIAEGAGKQTGKDQAKYDDIARADRLWNVQLAWTLWLLWT